MAGPDFEQARERFLAGTRALDEGRCEDAERELLASLALLPGRASTLVNLAVARLRLGRPADALQPLDALLAAEPSHADAWGHRGVALVELGRDAEAVAAFDRVLAGAPGHAAAWAHRGSALARLGRREEALVSFERALAADPGLAQVWSDRGQLLHELGRPAAAAASFERALALGADAPLNRFFLAAAGGTDAPAGAPRGYVAALFDDYAEAFDGHLVGALHYRVPERLAAALQPLAGAGFASALDLGCGTGLCAPHLRPLLRAPDGRLEGVDLSPRMVAKARAGGLYDRLSVGDLVEHLAATAARHDLVVAADVFIYVGDLEPAFAGVRRVLVPGGRFGFSVEAADDGGPGFVLRASRRYAHAEAYLRTLAARHGFEVERLQRAPIRVERQQPVEGLIVVLRDG